MLLENELVRVLRVAIEPGRREPVHTHRWASLMLVDSPARIRYYDGEGSLVFESPRGRGSNGRATVQWLEPEPPHSVENRDDRPYRGVRVELKNTPLPALVEAPTDT